ncbi:flagellar biosynthesis protein [Paenibacillus darwinianus]|uniref:Flagellar biosynthesis protein n=1 Tax=Paenibacillus darwinianus TaxID=1380763 RepID=A0A9W5S397_9BACL|nr:FliH/SctL family protein [Paenibacillus darwinianus]EXX91384.1 flagellar biosynthesis protein [Paenibacillus darwinianus]EXX92290.1 flagellar biosynthesis protein [Paenibacillus darwinianus]EXX92862.1 flagellar biosynthesis protein [Paenibacillus darwinianus]
MSNLIKSSYVVPLEDLRKLEATKQMLYLARLAEMGNSQQAAAEAPDEQTVSMKHQILRDAESFAEERLGQATAEIERMKRDAAEQIEAWWQERREQDLRLVEEARQSGFEQGFSEGAAHAQEETARQWDSRMQEARTLLEQAYRMKEQIIQEAEPFLVELSTAIAEKIIGKQLTVSPELSVELARKALSRRREQGAITLCVAPSQLQFVQAAREELSLAIDSQAELHILPDGSVKDQGCVVRSSFGSIDARIDTQLEEIKRELIQVALQSDERRRSDDRSAT